jgi:hypothetical protein
MSLRKSQRSFRYGRYNHPDSLDAAMRLLFHKDDHGCRASDLVRYTTGAML